MIFRKNPNPGVDAKRFLEMTNERRKRIDETPATPLPKTYAVNELSKAIHPNFLPARIAAIEEVASNCKVIRLEAMNDTNKFPYFRAGQYITLSTRVGSSYVTRPYSISSSPREALNGMMEVTVQKAGYFSSYLLEEAQVNDRIIVGEPTGDFCYDNIRDKNHIVAIAGGSGVTPFISMMKAIKEGSEDFTLTLIYGARSQKDLLINPSEYVHPNINVVVVLQNEEVEGYRHGLINKELLKEYVNDSVNVFMCGPDGMYKFVRKELNEIGFNPSRIRQEHNSIRTRPVEELKTYKLTVHIRDKVYVIDARNDETLLTAMERGGVKAPSRCRGGTCGFCHSRLIAGEYSVLPEHEYRRQADYKFGYVHPCSTYPESDMEIEVPVLGI